MVVDARAAGLARPIDGPYLSVRDAAGFQADSLVARTIGFQGKLCIHPAQVAAANRLFAPDPDEVAFCRRVALQFAEAVARGSASITVDGVFVDYPVADKAERIIRTAETFAARDAAAGNASIKHCRSRT
jgi:citrate lyase subunit beta/citryl-CoA lyase